jgi:glycosyltransferase involved in cell wall biosynthesis
MTRPLVSVVVPAYKRPKEMDDLLRSYRLQTLENSEIVIVDDGVDDSTVADVVRLHAKHDDRIRLEENETNLGYSRNFLNALQCARGELIVVLGDDDIFATDRALEKYVEVFTKNPSVNFVYSNLVQFNQNHELDWVFRHFDTDARFAAGEDSLRNTWLKSCYIPGIGLRNNRDFASLYPQYDMLFPQVEMIGRLLADSESFGISDELVAGRAHAEQLGFEALKGRKTKADERHSVEELGEIYGRIAPFHNQRGSDVNGEDRSFVDDFFRGAHATIFPTEKIGAGNRQIIRTFRQAMSNDRSTLKDVRFVALFVISLIMPRRPLFHLKEYWKRRTVRRSFGRQTKAFSQFLARMENVDVD